MHSSVLLLLLLTSAVVVDAKGGGGRGGGFGGGRGFSAARSASAGRSGGFGGGRSSGYSAARAGSFSSFNARPTFHSGTGMGSMARTQSFKNSFAAGAATSAVYSSSPYMWAGRPYFFVMPMYHSHGAGTHESNLYCRLPVSKLLNQTLVSSNTTDVADLSADGLLQNSTLSSNQTAADELRFANGSRPSDLVWRCKETEVCCGTDCCEYEEEGGWGWWIFLGFLVVIVLVAAACAAGGSYNKNRQTTTNRTTTAPRVTAVRSPPVYSPVKTTATYKATYKPVVTSGGQEKQQLVLMA
ncbi:CX domain-containing protein [Aphelenchoides fujianensis]|nr:CX domain-containing protein [Aphelenchoides fujianensis]